jgi:4-methylaminobutanoate oxidase (formaldehyde-forming)
MNEHFPAQAQIVIVGGGIAGSSLAYHLTKLGRTDVVLLERGRLTCGTTWHAAGLIMQLRGNHAMTELARTNVEFYANLEAETGQATGFKQNGTLGVCRTKDRLHETKRTATIAKGFGIEAHMIGPDEAKALYPAIDQTLVEGAIYIPKDGQTNPVDTTMSLIAGAKMRGAGVFEETPVLQLEQAASGDYRLETGRGAIQCETLVLACGLWTCDLAAQIDVRVPLYPCEHMYVVTEPLDFVEPSLPVLRDTDGYVYVKEDAGKLLVGAFEPQGKPLPMEKLPPDPQFVELPEDWDHYALPMTKAMEMLPELETAGISKFMNGPESFTPDLLFALGEAPGRRNCFISAGYNSEGIEFAPGAGRALAEWIVEGEPTMDLSHVDIARFHPFQVNRAYLHERAGESLGLHYKMHWPYKQREASRPARKSVLHDRWAARRACFGEAMGWERPLWFAPEGVEPVCTYSYHWPGWFDHTAEECQAARTAAIVLDQSSFGKHLVQGRDACRQLQRLCANDVDVAPGKLVYTHMLNRRGGIECDVTVNRLGEDRYLVISSATTQPSDRVWMERNFDPDARVSLTDVTSAFAVLSVQGPKSRALLGRLTDNDLSNAGFPFATSREIEIGYARFIANRLSYVGELGWELHVPTEFAQDVCDRLLAEGESLGLKPAGYHALEHLRSERAYREYELDLTPEDTPLEAGLGFTVRLDKPGGFIGRDALLRQTEAAPLGKRLVMFKLKDPEPVLFGEEVIWMDGRIAGYMGSGAYGFTLGASVGMGYVRHPDGVTKELVDSATWEIEIAGERYPTEASLRAFYDPAGDRGRG